MSPLYRFLLCLVVSYKKDGGNNVKNITNKEITYTDEFKYKLVKEWKITRNFGKMFLGYAVLNHKLLASQELTSCENIVNRVFKTGIPYNVLLTDITYLFYGDNRNVIYPL